MKSGHSRFYAGLSNIVYEGKPFHLGHGVVLRSTYAHFFGPNLVAFARASEGKHHPGPWRAARGGFGYDVEAELTVPTDRELPGSLSSEETIWLIAALIRLARHPYVTVPVISNVPFEEAAMSKQESMFWPFETVPRMLRVNGAITLHLSKETLAWIKLVWSRTAVLIQSCPSLKNALRSADFCTLEGRTSSALLAAWGALEELFSPSRNESRFRASANIAAYLEPVGPSRLKLFKSVKGLYDSRSKAAHTGKEIEADALLQTFVILRNALVKMIDEGTVPTQANLEDSLFCGGSSDDVDGHPSLFRTVS